MATTDEVQVWSISLDVPVERRAALERLLSPDERERADRYLVNGPRERFVVARGTVREVLGELTGISPEQLRFSYPCLCGKPDCRPSARKPRLERKALQFNVSHTEGLAMLAVSGDHEVGVDVERIDGKPEAFYRGWTRKEAYAKGKGNGLALGQAEAGEVDGWWLSDLPAPAGYVASLAVEGDGCPVRTGWWPQCASNAKE